VARGGSRPSRRDRQAQKLLALLHSSTRFVVEVSANCYPVAGVITDRFSQRLASLPRKSSSTARGVRAQAEDDNSLGTASGGNSSNSAGPSLPVG